MEEALEALKQVQNYIKEQTWWVTNPILIDNIEIAISKLEEAMKPKSCDGCRYDGDDWVRYCGDCTRRSIKDKYESKRQL